MKGLILNKGVQYYSTFGQIFKNIKDLSEKYNWLISDAVCYPQNKDYQNKFNELYTWMSGEELTQILADEDFQWIWAVFSGFDKNILLDEILKYDIPYAEGYSGFWKNPLTLQHPLSSIELGAWDSSCSLFLCENSTIIRKLKDIYPQAEDLAKYNSL